jgi:hypothetical protein
MKIETAPAPAPRLHDLHVGRPPGEIGGVLDRQLLQHPGTESGHRHRRGLQIFRDPARRDRDLLHRGRGIGVVADSSTAGANTLVRRCEANPPADWGSDHLRTRVRLRRRELRIVVLHERIHGGERPDLDRVGIDLTISELRAVQQHVQGRIGREPTAQRGGMQPFGHLGEENHLDAALVGEFLQRLPERLTFDFQIELHTLDTDGRGAVERNRRESAAG